MVQSLLIKPIPMYYISRQPRDLYIFFKLKQHFNVLLYFTKYILANN